MRDRALTQIATSLRKRSLSARELLQQGAERYRRLGPLLDAYRCHDAELAERCAAAADAAFASGADLGPLQGIPVSVKDLFGVQGLETFAGTPRALPAKWNTEGPIVTRLRRDLAVITGKTHMVELAFGGLGVNNHWPTPRNPWDARSHRVPGGSSSGAGVSLADGSALIALGTDTAGSVRVPASMTGNVGLKTSVGRWSVAGAVPLSSTLDTVGVLTRSVSDAAYAFAALDPRWPDCAALEAHIGTVELQDVRIGIGDACLWRDCEAGIDRIVEEALNAVAGAGARITEISLPEARAAIELLQIGSVVSAECDEFLYAELPAWRDTLDPIVSARIRDGGDIDAREYLARRRRLARLAAAAGQRFERCDVIAHPTVPIAPPVLDTVRQLEGYRARNLPALRNTCIANYLGLCAITLPAGLDEAGMPAGLQLIAPHGREEQLLGIALAVERVIGTPQERLGEPPLCLA